MRAHLVLLLLLISFPGAVSAQDYPRCAYHYFRNKRPSTSECWDTNGRWGRALAYNQEGKVIYERAIRRVGGHSSVEFTYYDNGAVRQARWYSAPDAGIQWYNTTTDFSEDGRITGETEHNYDSSPRIINY